MLSLRYVRRCILMCRIWFKLTHLFRHAGWGDYGWLLHAEKGTMTYGRSVFFIHGGTGWGLAGCIDLSRGDEQFEKYLSGQSNCYVPVRVSYVVEKYTISETNYEYDPE